MDEAHRLGLGRYLEQNGYRRRFDIMNEHLRLVLDSCTNAGVEPMIWSDMYFRLGSRTGGYYDVDSQIPQEVLEDLPQGVDFVYWDYYHRDEDFYRTFIRKHRAFGRDPIFAGGVWVWNGISPNYGKTFSTTNPALTACKKEGVRQVFATMWGDNGAETNLWAGLLGLQLFAEHGYAEEVEQERLYERFRFCTGGNGESFMSLNKLDESPGVAEGNPYESNPSKYLLWQDPLIGLYDGNIDGLPLQEHYAKLHAQLAEDAAHNGEWSDLFRFYAELARVLSIKSELGLHLKKATTARIGKRCIN